LYEDFRRFSHSSTLWLYQLQLPLKFWTFWTPLAKMLSSRNTKPSWLHYGATVCLFYAIFFASCHCSAADSPHNDRTDQDLRSLAARQAYNKGNYTESAALFRQALKASPYDAQLHYYLANSLLQLGSREEAKQEYSFALKVSRDKQLTEYCKKALGSWETSTATQSIEQESPGEMISPKKTANTLEPEPKWRNTVPEPNWRNLSAQDKSHVSMEGEGKTAERAYKDILWCLSNLPRNLKDAFWTADVKIVICKNIGDLSRVKGWGSAPNGFQWAQLHGITDHNMVYVTQTAGLGEPYIVKRPGDVLFHELGHAFDYNVGHHPHNPDMQELYDQDRAAQAPGTKYHNQIISELFPDLFAGITSTAAGLVDEKEKYLDQKKAYPRCWAYVDQCLSAYSVKAP
jgi:tetratricopeptide (TPR) repeat protein